jgi:hypothetical protein
LSQRSESELPFAARGIDRGDDAEIDQAISTPSTPPRVRTGTGLETVEEFVTSHAIVRPCTTVDPVTPVTVPVIQTSSAHTVPLRWPDNRRLDMPAVAGQPLGEGTAPSTRRQLTPQQYLDIAIK